MAAASPSPWLIWQLADSSFPSGGFAHSGGLEAAWQMGEVRSREDLVCFARASLTQSRHGAVPFLLGTYRQPEASRDWDHRCDLFLNNHVSNRASRLQGKAFLTVVVRSLLSSEDAGSISPVFDSGSCCHLAPVLGWVGRTMQLTEEESIRLLFYLNLRGLISAAVRLGIIGPMEGQRLQLELSSFAEGLAQACVGSTDVDAWQVAPLIDLFQGAQDRLYSRLFQS